jgi:hypothetical protein
MFVRLNVVIFLRLQLEFAHRQCGSGQRDKIGRDESPKMGKFRTATGFSFDFSF